MKSLTFLIPVTLVLIFCLGISYEYLPRDLQIVENLEYLSTLPEWDGDNQEKWNVLEGSKDWKPTNGNGSLPRSQNGIIWLRIRLPYYPSDQYAQFLLFSRVDQLFEVYCHRKLIYAYGKIENPPENSRYIGTPHHLIKLPDYGGGEYLYLRVYSNYTRIGIVGRMLSGEKSTLVEYFFLIIWSAYCLERCI